MHVINVRNVHEALPLGIHHIYRHGVQRESRNGDVLVSPVPVTTLYQMPSEMCCMWPTRDINPFATFFEGLWMLAGRNDVGYLTRFIKRFAEFSDDGKTLHGSYGHRWRQHFQMDQLTQIADALKEYPEDRRQILTMWDPDMDLLDQHNKKDLPCNVMVHFQTNVYGALDMTVFNRSNDMVWGTYGADAPHFGMLLQYMARKIGIPVGRYWQVSCNWHAYLKTLEPIQDLQKHARVDYAENLQRHSPYETGEVQSMDMMYGIEDGNTDAWDADLQMFMESEDLAIGYQTTFFKKVAVPLISAHKAFREFEGEDRYKQAAIAAKGCRATDWREMALNWLHRRWEKHVG